MKAGRGGRNAALVIAANRSRKGAAQLKAASLVGAPAAAVA